MYVVAPQGDRNPYTVISWDFVHAGARRASLSRAVCTKGFQMLLEVLHFPGFCARKGSTCFNLPFRKLPDNWAPKNTK